MVAAGGEPLVRKTVTVLFCDVVGSTSLGEQLDPETTRRVILRYFDETRAVLERHGGTVEKFIGDAVMAIFGVPVLHEDDALRAVRAGDELRMKLDGLNDELERQWGVRLEWRIAINTGEVVVGDPDSTQTIASGDTVNVAARLQQAAQPGEILLGRETYRLVSDRVRAGPLESFSLKGKSEQVKTWRLEEVRASAERVFRRLDAPLIGREDEQRVLHELYRRALDEQTCQLITVLGPAGIGKTRLAQEIAARLFGATVAQGRCLPYGDGITFFPMVEVVRSLAGVSADDAPEHIRARIAELAGGDDLVVDRIAGVLGIGGEARADESFWALRRLFEAVARERPLVLVLEDLHWAEPTLLDFVEYVYGWSRGAPLLVVCLARPELLESRAAWPGERIALSPLAADEVHALLGNLLGSAELEPDAARRIAAAAEGNPLFVEELVRMLVDDGTLTRSDGRWVAAGDLDSLAIPPTISALIAARLDRLDPEERLVLQSAAVIGKQFWWSAVTELAPPSLRSRVAAHLHGLVRKRLIFPAESTTFAGEDSFRFGHILVRDAAYGALPKTQRADLHERFADWLEQRGLFEEIRGHHLEQAYFARSELAPVNESTRALGERAAAMLGSAGRRAAARGDTPAAASLLKRAAALLPPGEQRAEVLVDLGMTEMRRGEFGRPARDSLEEAVASGDERIRLRAGIELAFLQMLVDPKHATRRMRQVAEESIPALEALGDDIGQARAWWLRSEVDVVACRWSDRATALERAIVHARRAGDDGQQGILLRHLAQALVYGPAPADEAIERCEELLADAANDPVLRASLLGSLAALRAMRGDFEPARALYAEARVIYDELGLNSLRAMRSLVPAGIEMLAGDPIAAERELRWGYDMLTALGERGVRSTLAAFLAEALYAQGRLNEAEQLTSTSEESAAEDDLVTQVVWRTARAKVLAQRHELDAAEQLAEAARELAADTDFPDLQATAALALAEVLLASGNRTDAEPLLEEAKDLYGRKGNIVAAERTGEVLAAHLA
jgi:class 3 adenylate cyclase/tetratricopeptide (TPR) repeat protein